MPGMLDPRPLVGEPLPLDLLNTRWNASGRPQDLLTSTTGLETWLTSAGRCPADEPTLRAVHQARDAIQAAIDRSEIEPLNKVLAHGRVSRRLTPEGPTETPEVDDPAWLPAWLAADTYLRLLTDAPGRVRCCAHPDCVLYFLDTSVNGRRRVPA